MKNTFLLIFLLFSSVLLSQTQKTLLTKRTATWCPLCGGWGWNFATALEDKNNPNTILIRAHYSGDLQSTAAQQITSNFDAVYQPEFYINEVNGNAGSSTWQSKVDDFISEVDKNAEKTPNISFFATSSITENTVNIGANAEVLKDLNGDYYFAAYLLEDNVVNFQASRGANTIHKNVLRQSFTADVFGEKMGEGPLSKGDFAKLDKTITPQGGNLEERIFKILLVVWKKEGSKYLVENIDFYNAGETTSVDELTALTANDINYFIRDGNLIINFDNAFKFSDLSVSIWNSSGQNMVNEPLKPISDKALMAENLPLLKNNVYFFQVFSNKTRVGSGKFAF